MRFGIAEDPRAETLLDELLLLAGGQRRLLVDDPLLAVAVVDRVVDHRGFHVEGQVEQPCAVGASWCRTRTWRRPTARRRSRRQGARRHPFAGGRPARRMDRRGKARRRMPGCPQPVSTGLLARRRCRPAARLPAARPARRRRCGRKPDRQPRRRRVWPGRCRRDRRRPSARSSIPGRGRSGRPVRR